MSEEEHDRSLDTINNNSVPKLKSRSLKRNQEEPRNAVK